MSNNKKTVGWGMLLGLLTYDGLVNGANIIEQLLGALPVLGDALASVLNSLGGLIMLSVFFGFYVRGLWRDKYTLTTMAGIISPFLPIMLPLASAVFILEKKVLREK